MAHVERLLNSPDRGKNRRARASRRATQHALYAIAVTLLAGLGVTQTGYAETRALKLKDVRNHGLRILPPNGTKVQPGEVIEVSVEVTAGSLPPKGVELGTHWQGIQRDLDPPYTFHIVIPEDRRVGLYTLEARASVGNETLTDKVTYLTNQPLVDEFTETSDQTQRYERRVLQQHPDGSVTIHTTVRSSSVQHDDQAHDRGTTADQYEPQRETSSDQTHQ